MPDRDAPEPADSLDVHRSQSRVRAVYDEIATHFSKTRVSPWPEVETFLDDAAVDGGMASPTRGLDVGSGNGRHAAVLASVVDEVIALDICRGLLAETRERMARDGRPATLVQGGASALPLDSGTVDLAVYVATLHHLPDRETRVRSLADLSRVLAEDGTALVSAWATAHDHFDADAREREGFDTTVDWTLPGGELVPRFYHIYAPAEFERDLRASGLVVEDAFVSSGNCYAVVS